MSLEAVTVDLFSAHRDGVFRYLCRVVGQAEAARDLTQEVFLRVSRTPPPVTSEPGQRAWLFTIARNLALNHVRDEQRRPAEVSAARDSGRPATQEMAASINEALATLPDVDRDVFLLREVAGLGYDEVAAACDLSADAVRSRLHRARQHLREVLGAPVADQRRRGIRNGR